MENRLKALEESVSLSEAEIITKEFSAISDQSEISDDAQQRILSSVMRKAGFEMKDTMTTTKTRKHSKRFIAFVAAAALMTTAAIGAGAYGIYVNHRQSVDRYLGDSAADTLEQQGLLDGSEIAATEHYRITQETVLSTGNVTSIILTFEGLDDEGKALINSHTKRLVPDFVHSPTELQRLLESGSLGKEEGDGYEVYMFTYTYRTPEQPITCPVSLYLTDDDCVSTGYPEYGEFISTVEFTTEPNVEGIAFTGEQNGKNFSLYDFALTSDVYIPIDEGEKFGMRIEYRDGSMITLGHRDFSDLCHAGFEGVTELTDVETQTNTRAVFRRLIDSANVSAVTINGERYVRQ